VSDQAIIGLVCALGGGVAALVYFLTGSIKTTVDTAIKDILDKLDELVKDISEVREKMAERNTVLVYLEKRIEQVEKTCRHCQKKRDKED
jgi:peptidoglycan hydrolase CwlO-like protein